MDYQTKERMALKRQAIPLPDLKDKTVLDIGCDHGYWSFLACQMGASSVLGIDRNRKVKDRMADLVAVNTEAARLMKLPCEFRKYDIGRQWPNLGRFDVSFLFSLYHHIYQNCGDHNAWQKEFHAAGLEIPSGC
jgi:SAM-dependent methyltransferase